MKKQFTIYLCFLSMFMSFAQEVTGIWQTIDDKTGVVKSQIEIYENSGKYYGKVLKVLDPDAPDNPICQNCDGDFKDQPIEGLEIMWGFKKDGKEYSDGTILDPENGKEYDCKFWLDENDPDKLNVRGYVLFLYRTQQWTRL